MFYVEISNERHYYNRPKNEPQIKQQLKTKTKDFIKMLRDNESHDLKQWLIDQKLNRKLDEKLVPFLKECSAPKAKKVSKVSAKSKASASKPQSSAKSKTSTASAEYENDPNDLMDEEKKEESPPSSYQPKSSTKLPSKAVIKDITLKDEEIATIKPVRVLKKGRKAYYEFPAGDYNYKEHRLREDDYGKYAIFTHDLEMKGTVQKKRVVLGRKTENTEDSNEQEFFFLIFNHQNQEYYVDEYDVETRSISHIKSVREEGDHLVVQDIKGEFIEQQCDIEKAVSNAKIDDIKQKDIADCYFKTALINMVNKDPQHLADMFVKQDGKTVTIRYYAHDKPVNVTVAKTLPHDHDNKRLYGDGALWVDYFLKAFVAFAHHYGKDGTEYNPSPNYETGYHEVNWGRAHEIYPVFYGPNKIAYKGGTDTFRPDGPKIDPQIDWLFEHLTEFTKPTKCKAVLISAGMSNEKLLPRIIDALPEKKNDAIYTDLQTHNMSHNLIDKLMGLKSSVKQANDSTQDQARKKLVRQLAETVRNTYLGDIDPHIKKMAGPARTLCEYLLTLQTADKGDTGANTQFLYLKHSYAITKVDLAYKSDTQTPQNVDVNNTMITLRNPYQIDIPLTGKQIDNKGTFQIPLATFLHQFGDVSYARLKK